MSFLSGNLSNKKKDSSTYYIYPTQTIYKEGPPKTQIIL